MADCPVCTMRLKTEPRQVDGGTRVDCSNCGAFTLTGSAEAVLSAANQPPLTQAKLAYAIRRRGGGEVSSYLMSQIAAETELPDAPTVVDNLLLHIAKTCPVPGQQTDLLALGIRAAIGAMDSQSAWWAIRQATFEGLLDGRELTPVGGSDEYQLLSASLTLAGWARTKDLLRSAKDSKKAFMAMRFGDALLDAVFLNHFKPAVKATGFDLVRLDESPRAGLIDDRLRVEIRTSRFLVADLTHANNGAYWEAGFAEGLGRPVIYTCRKDVFDDPATRPHFDTNHYLTVVWNPNDLELALNNLKSVIRVTLPAEAVLSD